MPVASESTSIKLVDVPMEVIKEHLEQQFGGTYSKMQLINQNDSELVYNTVYKGRNATVHIYRETHKPFELQLNVKFDEKFFEDQNPTSLLGGLTGIARWLLILLSLVVAFFLFQFIAAILSSNTLVFLFALVLLGGLMLYQIRPDRKIHQQDAQISELQNFLKQIKDSLTDLQATSETQTQRCWNCFEEIEPVDKVCAFCGKQQN